MGETCTAAIELAEELGWPLLPIWWIEAGCCACGKDCDSPGKHPIGKLAPHGLKDASADVETVNGWWQEYPKANAAVRTGDTCWVVDLDGLDGIRAFNQLVDQQPDLPETPSTRTGGGGRHIYFAADARIRNAAKLGGQPVDVRGQGGYALVPPSNHISGSAYCWELPPTKYDLAPAPYWLIAFATGGNAAGNGRLTLTVEGDLATTPGARQGERNSTLCRLVGAHLAGRGATEDLMDQAVAWGHRCQPPLGEKQVRKTVYSLAEKHCRETPKPQTAIVIGYNTIEAEDVTWLWQDRLAAGKLNILSGDPGLGKTYVCLDIAARVSAGRAFPDGASCEQGKAIIATCEDGPADTIRPRLDLLRADVANVFDFEGIRDDDGNVLPFSIDRHIPVLDAYLGDNEGVRLLVIDPISGFLGDVDSHKNAEVRGALAPLAKLAEAHGIAVVGINHLTKARGKAIYRSLGSLAFVAAARTAWGVVADPDDKERRLFLPVKNNLSQATGLAYRIVEGRIEWEAAPVLVAVDDLDEDDENATPRAEAKAWLQAVLADGPVEAKGLLKRSRADGIAEKTLRRAKKELKIESTQSSTGWTWQLPTPGEETSRPRDKETTHPTTPTIFRI